MPSDIVKERPILFSTPMIPPVLNGRKTQTRRVVKNVPDWIESFGYTAFTPEGSISGRGYWKGVPGDEGPGEKFFKCPFGKPGDRLWVRETWGFFEPSYEGIEWFPDRPFISVHEKKFGQGYIHGNVIWAADGPFGWAEEDSMEEVSRWKPSIHMPRWASRINLEITIVRVERLQEIREGDSYAEGAQEWAAQNADRFLGAGNKYVNIKEAFKALWESINGEGSWDLNPWVWVIEFRKIGGS